MQRSNEQIELLLKSNDTDDDVEILAAEEDDEIETLLASIDFKYELIKEMCEEIRERAEEFFKEHGITIEFMVDDHGFLERKKPGGEKTMFKEIDRKVVKGGTDLAFLQAVYTAFPDAKDDETFGVTACGEDLLVRRFAGDKK